MCTHSFISRGAGPGLLPGFLGWPRPFPEAWPLHVCELSSTLRQGTHLNMSLGQTGPKPPSAQGLPGPEPRGRTSQTETSASQFPSTQLQLLQHTHLWPMPVSPQAALPRARGTSTCHGHPSSQSATSVPSVPARLSCRTSPYSCGCQAEAQPPRVCALAHSPLTSC